MAGLPIRVLSDNFADNSIAAAWTTDVQGSGSVSEASGRATCALPSSTAGSHVAYYRAADTYDLTGDGCYININGMVATGVAATMTFDVYIDASNFFRWRQLSNTISARKVVAGVETQLYSATWSGTTYKYLRIRESGGTVYFDSSSNGTAWTNRATQTVAGAFAVTDLRVQFGASCGNIASPGTLTVEDFNVPALATTWRWVEARRETSHRIGSVSLGATGGGVGYLAIADSVDSAGALVSPRYFAGPIASGRALTEQASEAAAQALPVALPTDGRWNLPAGVAVEGRYVRLGLRATSGTVTLREYYPRRLVQADDIEAESIRALHVAAGAITADKISVLQLSAITADMGTITAGTVTGATIQTAASGARIELTSANGLRSYNSGGTQQVQIRTSDGELHGADSNVRIGSYGIRVLTPVGTTYSAPASYGLYNQTDGVYAGHLWSMYNAGNFVQLIANARTSVNSTVEVKAEASNAAAGNSAIAELQAQRGGAIAEIKGTAGATSQIDLTADAIYCNGFIQAPSISGTLTATGAIAAGGADDTRGLNVNAAADAYLSFQAGAAEKWTLGSETSTTPDRFAIYNTAGANYAGIIDATTSYWRIGDAATPAYRLELPNTASAAGQGRANAWATYSSRTRKRDIAEPSRQAVRDRVRALRAVEWTPDAGGPRDVGLIAEDVLAVWPELVTGDPAQPETLGLKYDRLGAILLPLVQELMEEVAQLKARAA